MSGDKEARGTEAERSSGEVGGGDAVGFGDGGVGLLSDVGESLALAVEEGVDRWLANVLNGEAKAKVSRGLLLARETDGLKEFRSVAEKEWGPRGGVPEDVPEAAKGGEGRGNLVPVGVGGLLRRSAYAGEPLTRGLNGS